MPEPRPSPTPASTIARLVHALREQAWIPPLAEADRPASLDEAYARQAMFEDALGYERFGWKVAGGSPRGLQTSPSGKAMFGRLWQPCRVDDGGRLALPPKGELTVEVEVAVRLGRDVDPSREPFDAGCFDAAFVAFEIVRSRFTDRKAAGQPSFIADNAGFHAFVLGPKLADGLDAAVFAQPASLACDGREVAAALMGDERTEPSDALAMFWRHAAEQQVRLPAGTIITTGTQTPPYDTRQPGLYRGTIGGVSVSLRVG